VKKLKPQQPRLSAREGGKNIKNCWLQAALAQLLPNSGQPL
jgi:hypothetical protein